MVAVNDLNDLRSHNSAFGVQPLRQYMAGICLLSTFFPLFSDSFENRGNRSVFLSIHGGQTAIRAELDTILLVDL